MNKSCVLYFLAISFLCNINLKGQDYAYRHYTTKDGLAGSTIYCILEDDDGYIWFATDGGVSKFNGTKFVNYSTKDGLSGNDVLGMVKDNEGAIWFFPASGYISFYKDGKIYNRHNNQLLARQPAKGFMYRGYLSSDSSIWILGEVLMRIKKDQFMRYDIPDQSRILSVIEKEKSGELIFFSQTNSYSIEGNKLLKRHSMLAVPQFTYIATHKNILIAVVDGSLMKMVYKKNKAPTLDHWDAPSQTISNIMVSDSISWICTYDNGVLLVSTKKPWLIKERFLKNTGINHVYTDRNKNIWFGSFNQGIFMLNKIKPKIITERDGLSSEESIAIFSDEQKQLWVGGCKGNIDKVTFNGGMKIRNAGYNNQRFERVLRINKKDQSLFVCTDFQTYQLNDELKQISRYMLPGSKDFCFLNDSTIIVALAGGLMKGFHKNNFIDFPKPWYFKRERTSSVERLSNEKFLYSNAKGLVLASIHSGIVNYEQLYKDKIKSFVNDIKIGENGELWLATYDQGIVYIGKDKTQLIDQNSGLNCEVIRRIFIKPDHNILAATNKGVFEISKVNEDSFSVFHFNYHSGFPVNDVFDITMLGDTIFAATAEGVVFFSEKAGKDGGNFQRVKAMCSLTDNYTFLKGLFNTGNHDINIKLETISYVNPTPISYVYNLVGYDSKYVTTTSDEIRYSGLSPGKYILNVKAVVAGGVTTALQSIPLEIEPRFSEQWWFRWMHVLLLIGVVYFVIRRAIKKRQLKAIDKSNMLSLELQALKTQMNPHFVFNSLNSIQNFLITHNPDAAKSYLQDFSRVIRKALNMSRNNFNTISEEKDYLQTYLRLEQLRFDGKFDYNITIDQNIDAFNTFIPSLLIQNYVENSIHHGIRGIKHQGKISIDFKLLRKEISCTITDNGHGINKMKKLKVKSELNNGIGLTLNERRADLINRAFNMDVQILVTDISDSSMSGSGTQVQILFPVLTHTEINQLKSLQ